MMINDQEDQRVGSTLFKKTFWIGVFVGLTLLYVIAQNIPSVLQGNLGIKIRIAYLFFAMLSILLLTPITSQNALLGFLKGITFGSIVQWLNQPIYHSGIERTLGEIVILFYALSFIYSLYIVLKCYRRHIPINKAGMLLLAIFGLLDVWYVNVFLPDYPNLTHILYFWFDTMFLSSIWIGISRSKVTER